MIRWIKNLIRVQEKREFNAENVMFFALFVGSMRLLMEAFLVGLSASNIAQSQLIYVSWYFMCFFCFGIPISLFAPPPWEKRINVMLVGLFLGFIPPIIDVIYMGWGNAIMGKDGFAYVYITDFPEGWPWLMVDSTKNLPIGEGAVLWGAVLFTGLYIWLRTNSLVRTIASLMIAYAVCVFSGAIIPTASEKLHDHFIGDRMDRLSLTVFAQIFVTFIVYFAFYRRSLFLLVMSRFLHALPLIGLTLVGYAWIKPLDIGVVTPVLLIAVSGILTIVQNDHWDDLEERPLLPERVKRHDVVTIQLLWLMIVIAIYLMDSLLAVIISIYGVASYLYNAPLYRGKRFFPANLKLEGLWGGSAFLIGVFAAALPTLREIVKNLSFAERMEPLINAYPFALHYSGDVAVAAFLAFGGWSLLATLKDEKDIAVDASLKTQTVFTLLMRRGVREHTIRRWIRALTFISLLIGAWGAFAIDRMNLPRALILSAIALLILMLRLDKKASEFRLILVALTVFLMILAEGVSASHS